MFWDAIRAAIVNYDPRRVGTPVYNEQPLSAMEGGEYAQGLEALRQIYLKSPTARRAIEATVGWTDGRATKNLHIAATSIANSFGLLGQSLVAINIGATGTHTNFNHDLSALKELRHGAGPRLCGMSEIVCVPVF